MPASGGLPQEAAAAVRALQGVQNPNPEPWPLFVANLMRWVEQGDSDKACVSCYRCYFKPYLQPADRQRLDWVSTDCRCDLK